MMLRQIVAKYNYFMGILNHVVGAAAALVLASVFVVMTTEVVTRFLFRMSSAWILEYGRFGLIYVVFLAGSILFYKQEHISITILPDKLSPKIAEILKLVFNIVTLYFLSLVFRSGWAYAQLGATVKSASQFTYLIVPRMAVPIGVVLMVLQVLNNTFLGLEKLLTYNSEKWEKLKEEAKSHEQKIIEETVEELEEIERLKREAEDDKSE